MECFGKTDKGKVRIVNQDYFIVNNIQETDISIIILCDGMGGANAGHIASKYACDSFYDNLRESIRADMDETYIKKILTTSINRANHFVFNMSKKEPEFAGMGTTLVAALVLKDKTYIINVGDSRAYSIEKTRITQITNDHSLVAEMQRNGQITQAESENHPKRNYITRAIGVEDFVMSDIFIVDNKKGVLLCSDGVTNMIKSDEIYNIISMRASLDEICDKIIAKSNANGGHDNITIAIIKF